MDIREELQALREENTRLKETLHQRDTFIRSTFGRFLTDEVLEEILEHKDDLKIGGERRNVTILFTDLRRSTELSEQMSPTDFIRMLNHYLEEMIEIINAWQGNILEFVGDAIVVVFGAPRPNEYAPRDAVACAVAMQRRMTAVNVWNQQEGYPEIAMGIGIHTGDAVLGNIGSATRTKYDMIGRNVNLASRIEGFTRGGQILVSTETLTSAGELVKTEPNEELWAKPKGIREEILLHSVIGFGKQVIPRNESGIGQKDPE